MEQESVGLVQLIKDLNQSIVYVVPLYCDNKSTISARTKHVKVHYHFVKEKNATRRIRDAPS